MAEYITRYKNSDGEYEVIFKTDNYDDALLIENQCRMLLDHLKPAEFVSLKHKKGYWTQLDVNPKLARCSECNQIVSVNGIDRTGHANIHTAIYQFCPVCGSYMRRVDA